MDPIFQNIQELKQERSRLEQKLEAVQKERLQHERLTQVLRAKEAQLKEKNKKMKETLKVAQYKVAESQGLLNHYEGLALQKREKVKEMEKQQEELEIGDGVSGEISNPNIQSLITKMRDAKKRYTEANLTVELREADKDIDHLDQEISEVSESLNQLRSVYQDELSKSEELHKKGDAIGFSKATQKELLEMCQDYDENNKGQIVDLDMQARHLEGKLTQLDREMT